jgi:hypothetical protein
MVFVAKRRATCAEDGCEIQPSFNLPGIKSAL